MGGRLLKDFPVYRRGELGRPYQFWPETTSTSDLLKEWARGGAPHGAVVATDFQRQGRGRQGRLWEAPRGEAILASVLLRRDLGPVEALGIWSLLWALAVAEAVEMATGLRIGVKWPNDVEVGGRKLAGILVEASLRQDQCEFLVVGIGVNVLQTRMPEDPLRPRTSLRLLTGRDYDRAVLFADVLWRGERWAARLRDPDGRIALLQAFLDRFQEWIGRTVEIQVGGERTEGTIVGIDQRGYLEVDGPGGRRPLPVGEVHLRREVGRP